MVTDLGKTICRKCSSSELTISTRKFLKIFLTGTSRIESLIVGLILLPIGVALFGCCCILLRQSPARAQKFTMLGVVDQTSFYTSLTLFACRRLCLRDTGIFAVLNTCVSFIAGCIIFTTLGYMSETSGIPIARVAEAGPGLAFVAYPKALSTMPLSPLWSVLFFLILLLLGLDSQFVGVEGFVTAAVDMFPDTLSVRRNRVIFTAATCIVCFVVGLLMVTNGGIYVFQLFDYFVGCRIVLLVAFSECVVIGFMYGSQKFGLQLTKMYSRNFYCFPTVAYCIIAPLFALSLFIMSVMVYGRLTYKTTSGIYEYPGYATVLGWLLASCSLIFIPIVAVYRICQEKGPLLKRLRILCKPNLPEVPENNHAAKKGGSPFTQDSSSASL